MAVEKAPYVGYIGDHRGGLTLRPADAVDAGEYPCAEIDLGHGIPRERALDLADKLRAVLQEIVEAQRGH